MLRGGSIGGSGSGGGDLLAANNLSDVANAATSLSNLGGIGSPTANFEVTNKLTLSRDLTPEIQMGAIPPYVYMGSSNLLAGALYTLLGNKSCPFYQTFNFQIDGTGDFSGRDSAAPCILRAISSNGVEWFFYAPSAGAGSVPVFTNIYFTDGSGINAEVGNGAQRTGIFGVGSFQLMTSTRIWSRVSTTATGGSTPAMNTDNYDEFHFTAQDADITSFTSSLTGTPNNGDITVIEITADATPRAVTWGAKFEDSSLVTLPTSIPASTLITTTVKWNVATSKWRCVGVA